MSYRAKTSSILRIKIWLLEPLTFFEMRRLKFDKKSFVEGLILRWIFSPRATYFRHFFSLKANHVRRYQCFIEESFFDWCVWVRPIDWYPNWPYRCMNSALLVSHWVQIAPKIGLGIFWYFPYLGNSSLLNCFDVLDVNRSFLTN